MCARKIAPFGAWKSPITSDLIVAETIQLGFTATDGADIYWLEGRPQERGRYALVRYTSDGRTEEVLPHDFNTRTRVHEYGGGAYWVKDGVVFAVNFADQRLYRKAAGEALRPLTPAGMDLRFADGVFDSRHNRLICVREDHRQDDQDASNTIVSLALDGDEHEGDVLVSGADFYSTPRLSPDGRMLTWLAWDHPNMPWDGTTLWLAEVLDDGTLGPAHRIAGGDRESVFQPEWSPDGVPHFVSDVTGWWNLYRYYNGRVEPLHPREAEFGLPQWVFGMTTYGLLSDGRIVCRYSEAGAQHLALLGGDGRLEPIDLPYSALSALQVGPDFVVLSAASPTESTAIVRLEVSGGRVDVLQRSTALDVDPGYLSHPEPITFPTENGLDAHGYYYAPKNKDFQPPEGEKPPLIVMSHGGPTSSISPALNLSVQYWTSRGFAVVDVNYGGSTGYGRAYWQRLNGQWGIVDVDDCANAARFLAAQGLADGERLAIRGGSAGGYTTLCALTFSDLFAAGASYFGISDLAAMTLETHKFESRYLDNLVAPYPEREDIYTARSPLHHSERLSRPVIFFQGLEDKIVPPNQAEMLFAVLKEKGIPTAYLPFEGEQHGFRRAENIKRALDAELYFYGKVLGFVPADEIEPVDIQNLENV